jgi:spore coat protein U-like protein
MFLPPHLRLLWGTAMLLGIAFACRAVPAQETDILTVRAVILGACNVTGGVLDFGIYEGQTIDQTAEITYSCDPAAAVTIALGEGNNFQGNRRLVIGAVSFLNYFLYQDGARTIEWGNAPGSNFAPLVISEVVTSGAATVYGSLPGDQDLNPGVYEDSVLITLTVNP